LPIDGGLTYTFLPATKAGNEVNAGISLLTTNTPYNFLPACPKFFFQHRQTGIIVEGVSFYRAFNIEKTKNPKEKADE
jgi:hypothetical protein